MLDMLPCQRRYQDAPYAIALAFFFVVALYRIGTKRVEAAVAAKDAQIKVLSDKNAALRACLPKPMSPGQYAAKLKLKRGLEALRAGAAGAVPIQSGWWGSRLALG